MSLLQFTDDLRSKTLSIADKYASFQNFVLYFDIIKNAVLNTQTYTDKQLSEHIFKVNFKESQAELILKKHIFAAYNTIHRLDSKVNVGNFSQYEFLINMLAYDLYGMVAYAEENYRNNKLHYDMGTRGGQDAREIFDISRALFEAGRLDPANFYLREIIPVSVFLIRQTIEVYGKLLLGFVAITDENGNRVRVSTQVSWDFIKEELKKTHPRITLPTHIDIVREVEQWTNYYIHTGNIPEIHLIENAIHLTDPLIYPRNASMRNYLGSVRFAGTSTLRNYNDLKRDFEAFINQRKQRNLFARFWNWLLIKLKLRKQIKKRVVHWLNEKQVDATILSL